MEIERKFLVKSLDFIEEASLIYTIKQGYLRSPDATIRIRTQNDEAFITIKGASDETGLMREEWEYPIPLKEAEQIFSLCGTRYLEKKRYLIPQNKHTWEVDIFEGKQKGLILAEIELSYINEYFDKPSWLGEEVTGDKRFYNASMCREDWKLPRELCKSSMF